MRIMILGASGMIGRKLALRLADMQALADWPISDLLLVDRLTPRTIAGHAGIAIRSADIADQEDVAALAAWNADVIFQLAAIVSGEAEADFAKGYKVNLNSMRLILDAIKATGRCPRLVNASSLAVYGSPLPDVVPDDFVLTPQSSYGVQKAIGEMLVADYSRKGFVDGISVRLPTIVVRPGAPNRAASSFLSGMIREPLNGLPAVIPVGRELQTWIASPAVAVDTLIHAATLDWNQISSVRALTGRGIAVTVGEIVDSLREVAGTGAVKHLRDARDPMIERIVTTWPKAFTASAATRLGFPVDQSIRSIIRAYITDELGGRFALDREIEHR